MYLIVGDKATLNPPGLALSQGRIEHIALAHQLFRAGGVQNDPGLHGAGHGEGNARGNVGLHEAGDDVRRGTLGGDDQVDARSTSHLRHTADGLLHFLGRHQHEVGQLIDDHHNLRQGLAILHRGAGLIIGVKIPDAGVGHHPVALHHLRHRPLEGTGCLFRVGDHGYEQMGDAVVNAQLHHLGIHHDEANLLGLGLIEQGNNQAIHAHRLTRTGGTGDEQMRQLCNVADDAVAADVLAHGEGDAGLALVKLHRVDDVPDVDGAHQLVGHLDAHDGDFIGDGGNADARGAQCQGNVVGKVGELGELHAAVELQLIAGDRGAADDVDDMGVDAEAHQRVAQALGVELHLLGAVHHALLGLVEEPDRRVGVDGLLLPCLGNFRGNLRGLQPCLILLGLARGVIGQDEVGSGSVKARLLGGDGRLLLGRRGYHQRRFLRLGRLLHRHRLRLYRLRLGCRQIQPLQILQTLQETIRLFGRLFLLRRFLFGCGTGNRLIVQGNVKVLDGAAAALGLLNLPRGYVVDQRLGGIGMLALGRVILRLGTLPVGANQAGNGHGTAEQQREHHENARENHRAGHADGGLERHGQKARDNTAGGVVNAGLPQLHHHGKAPLDLSRCGKEMSHHAPAQGDAQRAAHPQPNRPAVVEEENEKRAQQGKGQYINAGADETAEQRHQRRDQKCLHAKEPQQRQRC